MVAELPLLVTTEVELQPVPANSMGGLKNAESAAWALWDVAITNNALANAIFKVSITLLLDNCCGVKLTATIHSLASVSTQLL